MSMILDTDIEREIAEHARRQGYDRPMDYLRALLRRDRRVTPASLQFIDDQQLERQLLEGLSSGPARQIGDADWKAKEQALIDRHSS